MDRGQNYHKPERPPKRTIPSNSRAKKCLSMMWKIGQHRLKKKIYYSLKCSGLEKKMINYIYTFSFSLVGHATISLSLSLLLSLFLYLTIYIYIYIYSLNQCLDTDPELGTCLFHKRRKELGEYSADGGYQAGFGVVDGHVGDVLDVWPNEIVQRVQVGRGGGGPDGLD